MPLHVQQPIVRVEPSSMRCIEVRDTETLFGLWSIFARCSPAIEDGKRYENLAWRLWSRQTFCCQPDHLASPHWSFSNQLPAEMPELSTSVASDDSNLDSAIASTSASRPDLRRHDSANSQARGKHLTPIGLEKVVNSIQEKKFLEPLSPLPPQLAGPVRPHIAADVTTPRPASPPTTARRIPDSSSTVATTQGSEATSPPIGSEASTSTDISQSSHSVVRGFERGHISTSIRSSTNLAQPASILKPSSSVSSSFVARPLPSRHEFPRKKAANFIIGGSSEEDANSSIDAMSYSRNSLNERQPMRKTTSFINKPDVRTYHEASESEAAIETDSEDDVDESAIEEDDSEEEWEDDDDDAEVSGAPSRDEPNPAVVSFPRTESTANLVSHRSLLSAALHEGDRARHLANDASRSQPAIRRSRTTTPNGPSTGNSPQEEGLMMRTQATRSKPIIMTTSNVHPPAMSPRTTRRMMLQSELTSSLRQNLLWERQQKNATNNAVAKRQHSAISLPALRRAATTSNITALNNGTQQDQNTSSSFRDESKYDSQNQYFDNGLLDYHMKGW